MCLKHQFWNSCTSSSNFLKNISRAKCYCFKFFSPLGEHFRMANLSQRRLHNERGGCSVFFKGPKKKRKNQIGVRKYLCEMFFASLPWRRGTASGRGGRGVVARVWGLAVAMTTRIDLSRQPPSRPPSSLIYRFMSVLKLWIATFKAIHRTIQQRILFKSKVYLQVHILTKF